MTTTTGTDWRQAAYISGQAADARVNVEGLPGEDEPTESGEAAEE